MSDNQYHPQLNVIRRHYEGADSKTHQISDITIRNLMGELSFHEAASLIVHVETGAVPEYLTNEQQKHALEVLNAVMDCQFVFVETGFP